MRLLVKLFSSGMRSTGPSPRQRRKHSARLQLEGLEDRTVPSTLLEVVPLSDPTDATHFHSFAAAYQQAQSATHDIIQIEPGAVLSPGTASTISIDKANITIQGDPSYAAADVTSSLQVQPSATGVTLNNLNFAGSSSYLGLGSQTTVENSFLYWVGANKSHSGDFISRNTITNFLYLQGDPTIQANDFVQLNRFTGYDGLQLTDDNGAYIDANTFYLKGSSGGGVGLFIENSQNVSIHNNSITVNGPSTHNVGIFVQDEDHTWTPGTTSLHLWWNTIDTGSWGRGLVLLKYSAAANSLSADVELNDFRNNLTGVFIRGDGSSAGTIDLGGGPLGSAGQNNFASFSAVGANAGDFAISLHGTSSTSVVYARNNNWGWQQSGTSVLPIDPSTVVRDGSHYSWTLETNYDYGAMFGSGFIDVSSTSSGNYGGGGGGGGSGGQHGVRLM
jgi:hypothetical protein